MLEIILLLIAFIIELVTGICLQAEIQYRKTKRAIKKSPFFSFSRKGRHND